MKQVTVPKDKLLATLIANMETHEADFEIAWEGYARKVTANLQALLDNAKTMKRGEQLQWFVGLTAPVNHRDDYERAIQMLHWHMGDTIELDARRFEELVMDRWDWKDAVSVSNKLYTGSASPSRERA